MDKRIAYAVCRGTYHIKNDLPCQDAAEGHKWGEYAAVALADGAGSCQFSQEGAETVVQTVLDLLEKEGTEWLNGAIDEVAEHIVSVCLEALAQNPYEVTEQSSTLLFCIVGADGDYLCGHLGDGCVFRVTDEGAELLSAPENGEARNETVFVTSPHAEKHLRVQLGTLQAGDTIILCSDGCDEALYARNDGSCAPALVRMAEWMRKHEEAVVAQALENNLDQVFRSASPDDMSIAIISCQ